MTSYRLFASTNGPAAPINYSGNFQAAVVFGVTSISWLEGYWWWVCPTNAGESGGQSTAAQKFCLWQVYGAGQGVVIPGSVVTSGTLQAGWNWIALAQPIPLSVANDPANLSGDGAAVYIATTAFSGPFPDSNGQFGSGEPYAGGIRSGPLVGYSDQTGTFKAPGIGGGLAQGQFGIPGGADPTVALPRNDSSGSSNFWMDVQVSDAAPSGYSGSYRLYPNYPTVYAVEQTIDTEEQTMGTQFALSEACTLNNVWFYSPSFAAALPTRTQIWDISDYSNPKIVAGTDIAASWVSATSSTALGSGWVANSYAGLNITLPAGHYVATIYYAGGGVGATGSIFYLENRGYFGTDYVGTAGPAPDGLTNGPLSTPSNASAFNAPTWGNTCYFVNDAASGSGVMFPSGWDHNDDGENRWVDVEVTPGGSTTPPPPPTSSSSIPLTFFP
jgi:hypothetical protein